MPKSEIEKTVETMLDQEETLRKQLEELQNRLREAEERRKAEEARLAEEQRLAALTEEQRRQELERKRKAEAKQAFKQKWASKVEKAGLTFYETFLAALQDGAAQGLDKVDCLVMLGDGLDRVRMYRFNNDLPSV